jgi:hypothetical protein
LATAGVLLIPPGRWCGLRFTSRLNRKNGRVGTMTTTTDRSRGVFSRMMIVGLLAGTAGCFPSQPPPPPAKPAYQPNFAYKTGSQEKKLEVTIGIIEPQFTAATAVYHQSRRNDEMHKLLLSELQRDPARQGLQHEGPVRLAQRHDVP